MFPYLTLPSLTNLALASSACHLKLSCLIVFLTAAVRQNRVTRVIDLWLNRDKSATFFATMVDKQLGPHVSYQPFWKDLVAKNVALLSRLSHKTRVTRFCQMAAVLLTNCSVCSFHRWSCRHLIHLGEFVQLYHKSRPIG